MSGLPKGWCSIEVSEAVSNLPLTGKKIPQKQYLETGTYPIVDQGQPLVGGYSNDVDALIDCAPPVIVFGDHTKVVKLVRFRFAPGADGIKVLKPHGFFDCLLFKYFLDHITVGMIDKGYARHYQHLANRKIHVPPLAEQRRIVAKVEALFSELEAGVAALKQARAQLAVYRQALLRDAFEGRLTAHWRSKHAPSLETGEQLLETIRERHGESGEPISAAEAESLPQLPEGWCHARFGEFIQGMSAGKSFSCEERPPRSDEIGVAKVSAVTWGEYLEEESKTCRDASKINPSYFIQAGDFLLSRANTIDLVGASVIVKHVTKRIMLSDKTLRLTIQDIPPFFLLYYLRSRQGRREIMSRSTGNQESMRNIGQDRIRSIIVPVCSETEALKIVEVLEAQLSELDALETDIDVNLAKAEALRQAILKKAFAGELVPQDPDDEPAAALLARIQAERAAVNTPSSKNKAARSRSAG